MKRAVEENEEISQLKKQDLKDSRLAELVSVVKEHLAKELNESPHHADNKHFGKLVNEIEDVRITKTGIEILLDDDFVITIDE